MESSKNYQNIIITSTSPKSNDEMTDPQGIINDTLDVDFLHKKFLEDEEMDNNDSDYHSKNFDEEEISDSSSSDVEMTEIQEEVADLLNEGIEKELEKYDAFKKEILPLKEEQLSNLPLETDV